MLQAGLGLKPDLYEDIVVAPYATVLTLPLAPHAASRNLATLERQGLMGRYGWYEAVDYTPNRLPRGGDREIIRSWMAHHQGMVMVSLGNYLVGARMPARFHADPLVRSAEILLQERNPHEVPTAYPQTQRGLEARAMAARNLRNAGMWATASATWKKPPMARFGCLKTAIPALSSM